MTRINKKILFPELSYKLTGLFYKIHSELGRFCRERQYADKLEELLKENNISYKREFELKNLHPESVGGNKVDFVIENCILVEIKAKKFITKEDYYQILRYLEASLLELGLIVNFRNTHLKPKRVLNSKLYHSDNSGD
jgi:GxxExxY protein